MSDGLEGTGGTEGVPTDAQLNGDTSAPEGTEDILPLGHGPELPDAVNRTIRIAEQRGKQVEALNTELAELRGIRDKYQIMDSAVQAGDLVFRNQEATAPAAQAPALNGSDGLGDTRLDEASRLMEAGDPEGTRIVLREIAGLKSRNVELEDRAAARDASSAQTQLRGGIARHFESKNVALGSDRLGLVMDAYKSRVQESGHTLGQEPPALQHRILDALQSALALTPTEPTISSASPDTTSGRGAGLSFKAAKLEPKAHLSVDDIIGELKAGNI